MEKVCKFDEQYNAITLVKCGYLACQYVQKKMSISKNILERLSKRYPNSATTPVVLPSHDYNCFRHNIYCFEFV